MSVEKQVTVKVKDTGGKTWTLTATRTGVKIEGPVSWRTRPIPFRDLLDALNELGRDLGRRDVDAKSESP